MKQVKFLGALYILNAVLPILSRLSQQFQAGRFHFSMVKPAMKRVQSELMELKNGMEPVEKLKSDIDSTYVNISDTLKLTKNTEKELTSMLSKYTESLSVNMEQRLGAFPDVIGAYSIFDPISLRSHKDIDMYQYGTEEISILGNHFYPGSAETTAKLKTQWHQIKHFLSENPICVPDGSQSSTYLMTFMLQNKGIFHPVLFAEILYVVEIGLSLPCSNAWPERGASILKLAKSKTRNRLENDMLNSIMHVTINGPTATSNLCSDIVSTAVSTWCQAKKRKKLKTKRFVLTPVTDMNVEEEFGQEGSCLATSNEHYGVESDRVPVGAEVVADKLGLPPIDTDEDSALESDYDSN